jgi:hypothetical protein
MVTRANKPFGNVVKFKYLEPTVTMENCIHIALKAKLNSEKIAYHSVQNRSSSQLPNGLKYTKL